MEVSRGTAYGVGLSQTAVTLGIILYSPEVSVDTCTVMASADNATGVFIPAGGLRCTHIHVGLPLFAASLLAAIFSTSTCRMNDGGLGSQDYQGETMETVAFWDVMYWVYCLLSHLIVVLMLGTPSDAFCCLSATSFMVYFLFRACCPKSRHINLTQENLNMLGYGIGALQAAYQIQGAATNRLTSLFLVVVLDYFMGVGHTWDREATLDTVINCRLCYVCFSSLGLAGMYAAWGEWLS